MVGGAGLEHRLGLRTDEQHRHSQRKGWLIMEIGTTSEGVIGLTVCFTLLLTGAWCMCWCKQQALESFSLHSPTLQRTWAFAFRCSLTFKHELNAWSCVCKNVLIQSYSMVLKWTPWLLPLTVCWFGMQNSSGMQNSFAVCELAFFKRRINHRLTLNCSTKCDPTPDEGIRFWTNKQAAQPQSPPACTERAQTTRNL